MCYNCGCGKKNDPMVKGHAGVEKGGKSITEKTFQAAADSQKMGLKETKKNVYKLLKEELKEK